VILVVKIVVVLLVVLIMAGIALRVRKLRRDEMRELSRPVERRLFSPPPSPYAPSKGFRLIDESGEPLHRPPVERPRLDPDRHYVFSETTSSADDVVASHLRHNDDWFLSRSAHRSTLSIMLRRVVVVVLIALIIAVVVAYYLHHGPSKGHQGSTTSSTTLATSTTTTTTTVSIPSAFQSTSVSGDDAFYSVPETKYQVAVSGSLGATWAVYQMGPQNTLEWQGRVAIGHDESLTMTGDSRVTIGSPSSATVSVAGSPVVFPTPLPATLILVFHAANAVATSSG
jgi:hypothetical protein